MTKVLMSATRGLVELLNVVSDLLFCTRGCFEIFSGCCCAAFARKLMSFSLITLYR